MTKLLTALQSILKGVLVGSLTSLFNAINHIFEWLIKRDERKTKEKEQKKIDKAQDELDNAIDKGSLSDLLDATTFLRKSYNIFLVVASCLALAGCFNFGPVVEPTKPYEGHYMTVDEFKQGTSSMKLDKGESVWVLSNSTLKRLLRNTGK